MNTRIYSICTFGNVGNSLTIVATQKTTLVAVPTICATLSHQCKRHVAKCVSSVSETDVITEITKWCIHMTCLVSRCLVRMRLSTARPVVRPPDLYLNTRS